MATLTDLRRATNVYGNSYPDWVTSPPTPVLTSLNPSSIVAGTPTPVTVNGTDFTPASKVYVDGAGQITQHVSDTVVRYVAEATAPPSQDVEVHNGVEVSNSLVLTVTATSEEPETPAPAEEPPVEEPPPAEPEPAAEPPAPSGGGAAPRRRKVT